MLEDFIPNPQVRERHEITVRAPAAVVFETACKLDLASIPLVRAIFWMRARILRAKNERQRSLNLIEGMRALGWQCLAQQDGRFYIAGAVCQPWNADVVFEPVAPDRFASYAVPDQVKIAWSIEAEPLGPALTRFVTETRAIGTGEAARRKFRRYWRFFGIGIVLIRKLLLARLRRIAEKTYRDTI